MGDLSGSVDSAPPGVEVALLDMDGVIVAVNETWSRFSEENDGDLSRAGVGMSYLGACDAAGDLASEIVADSIRAATAGDLPASVTVHVPGSVPGQSRFSRVMISSRVGPCGKSIGATVTSSRTALPSATSKASGMPVNPSRPRQGLGGQMSPDAVAASGVNAAIAAVELSLADAPRLQLEELPSH